MSGHAEFIKYRHKEGHLERNLKNLSLGQAFLHFSSFFKGLKCFMMEY